MGGRWSRYFPERMPLMSEIETEGYQRLMNTRVALLEREVDLIQSAVKRIEQWTVCGLGATVMTLITVLFEMHK